MHTDHLLPDAKGIARAADLLGQGELVALPTETVYGLAGDARSDRACARIFAAKDRPRFNPLIVHVPDLDAAQRLARFSPQALRLAQAFWPGPLTLVAPLLPGHGLSALVTAGLDTVAIRVPAHPVAQQVLRAFGAPVAAPSANPSGRISPSTPGHVAKGLGGKIAAILEGGPCAVGLESTILDSGPPPVVLRQGGISQEAIEAILQTPIQGADTSGKITAPGQLRSHYAPIARVRLGATAPLPGEVMLGFGAVPGDLSLSATGDLVEAAAALFASLHAAEALATERGADTIAVAPIPDIGLGRAINDRLSRAAAPRDA